MTTKYLVINEATLRGTDTVVTEFVRLHATLQGALDYIHELAAEHDVFVEDDADSVYLPSDYGHIESDEYYIAEIEECE